MNKEVKPPSIIAAFFMTVLMFGIGLLFNPTSPNLTTLMICAIVGAILPFTSLYLTWWFYTLGGKFPLPIQHKWITQSLKITGTKTIGAAGLTAFAMIGAAIGQIIYIGYFKNHSQNIGLFFQFIIPVLVFGFALTTSTAIKRKQLLAK